MDVGILCKPPNKASYFVNEVEGGITTSLRVEGVSHTAGTVGMNIAPALKHCIAREKTRLDVRDENNRV